MIKATLAPQWRDTPIAIITNRYEIRIDITEAESLIEDLEHAVESAKVLNCPRTRREMVYGPGNIPTAIPINAQYEIPVAELEKYRINKEEE